MSTAFGFGVTCLKPPPVGAIAGLPVRVFQHRGGECAISIDLAASNAPDKLLDMLEETQTPVRSFNFGMRRESNDELSQPESLTIGALLLTDGFCRLDPNNVFEPRFPPPHLGKVPEQAPLLVDRRPDYPVCRVLDEDILCEQLCRFLQRHADCDLGDVVYQGEILSKWHRVFPRRMEDVIPQFAVYETPCVGCGVTLRTHPGVVVGHQVRDLTICRNTTGMRHAGLFPPIVISVSVAKEMVAKRLRGFGISPIIDIDSEIGRRIVELAARLNKIKLRRIDDPNTSSMHQSGA